MTEDIRDKPSLTQQDILHLNFIRHPGAYFYRRHYRAGLRSHIMAVLRPSDVDDEKRGVLNGGLRVYPKARPVRMLRIFRTRFERLDEAVEEVGRVKMVERYLGTDSIARSEEFLVDYEKSSGNEILLCGLQEYVEGEILDPWGYLGRDHMMTLHGRMSYDNNHPFSADTWFGHLHKIAERFINNIKRMIIEARHVPDLAGVGNLLIDRSGNIKLVDINNISEVFFNQAIRTDDIGYPVCDKSIEALSHLEQKLLGKPLDMNEKIYNVFLDPGRQKEVTAMEEAFHMSHNTDGYYKGIGVVR
ncbi:MAG: hypothetical protein JRJ85_20305 [Deltaproteobacteria bacterium]|nr:hypothetical protein [Deltaproteobacteria bacterium]